MIDTTVTNPLAKLAADPTTKSKALRIKAKCAECMGCAPTSNESGFRRMIRECSAFGCPLWPIRPYQGDTDDLGDLEDITAEEW